TPPWRLWPKLVILSYPGVRGRYNLYRGRPLREGGTNAPAADTRFTQSGQLGSTGSPRGGRLVVPAPRGGSGGGGRVGRSPGGGCGRTGGGSPTGPGGNSLAADRPAGWPPGSRAAPRRSVRAISSVPAAHPESLMVHLEWLLLIGYIDSLFAE